MRFFLIFVLGCLACVSAQEGREVKLRFATVGLYGGKSKIKLDEKTEVQLSLRYPSAQVRCKIEEGQALKIYGADQNFEAELVAIGAVRVPANLSQGTVLLIPYSKGYKCHFISEKSAPEGGVYLYNLSDQSLGFVMRKGEKMIVDSGQGKTFQASQSLSENIPVKIFRPASENSFKLLFSTSWRMVPNRREILIFYNHPKTGKVAMKGISQYGAVNR
ncbi:hypothetical protein [Rubritalea tangerina]|uniref:Uncharacterized protein n=1 Tax=Rubritalea tangerina TaxID=430798 RepID=A0ABW4ZF89_9BACT